MVTRSKNNINCSMLARGQKLQSSSSHDDIHVLVKFGVPCLLPHRICDKERGGAAGTSKRNC